MLKEIKNKHVYAHVSLVVRERYAFEIKVAGAAVPTHRSSTRALSGTGV